MPLRKRTDHWCMKLKLKWRCEEEGQSMMRRHHYQVEFGPGRYWEAHLWHSWRKGRHWRGLTQRRRLSCESKEEKTKATKYHSISAPESFKTRTHIIIERGWSKQSNFLVNLDWIWELQRLSLPLRQFEVLWTSNEHRFRKRCNLKCMSEKNTKLIAT